MRISDWSSDVCSSDLIYDGLRKIGVLGKETIARMNCFRPTSLRGGEDFIASKIAFYGRRRSDMNRFIGLADVQRIRVRIRINADSSNAHLARRANDPASDLSAIGDEERLDNAEASEELRVGTECVRPGGSRCSH